jgi:hypothetical protein
MKSRNFLFTRALAQLPQLDSFQPENADDPTGGGALVNPFDDVDFKVVRGGTHILEPELHYKEVHLASSTGGSDPISDQDHPERAILGMPLPIVGANWGMTLSLEGPGGTDNVKISRIAAKYAVLRAEVAGEVVFEETDEFFTVQIGAKEFETYVNINQVDEVVKLKHSNAAVFDLFSMSFLGQSNG